MRSYADVGVQAFGLPILSVGCVLVIQVAMSRLRSFQLVWNLRSQGMSPEEGSVTFTTPL